MKIFFAAQNIIKAVSATLLTVALITLTLTQSANAQPSGQRPIVVSYNMGGNVGTWQKKVRKIRHSGQRVEIKGRCYSSCTMYLGLDNVCVSPNAVLGFHGPKAPFGRLATDIFDHWSDVMSRDLPDALRVWFMEDARYVKSGVKKISGQTLIANLGFEQCGNPRA